MSTLTDVSQSNLGWIYPVTLESADDRYHPEIVAILTVNGTPSLQGLQTTTRPVSRTVVDFVIVTGTTPSLQTWRLDEGAATSLDTTEVAPFDYNATTNDKHWKLIGVSGGGFGIPQNAQNGNYTITSADNGKALFHDSATPHTYTIPANASVALVIGHTTTIINNTGAGNITVAITTDTLRRGDGTAGTGSRTVPPDSIVTITKTKSTEWMIAGKFT